MIAEIKSKKQNHRLIEAKRTKFVVAATKMISYVGLLLTAFFCLQSQISWFRDPFVYHIPFEKALPLGIRILYLLETSYYVYTLFTIFLEPRMKDRNQMILHHAFTLFLLLTSYYFNGVKYGTAIVVLHDISDPIMETAKLFNYVDNQLMANVFFVLFAASFFYLRLWIFPSQIILSTL